MFENCTDCLFNDKILLKSQQRFKSDCHNVCTEQINKIVVMMIKDCKDLIKVHNLFQTEQMHLKYAKAR